MIEINRPITVVAAGILIDSENRYLLGQRPAGKPYAGYWEVPGGKVEKGETIFQALQRELQAAFDAGIRACAIVFMHGYRFTAHEQAASGTVVLDLIGKSLPKGYAYPIGGDNSGRFGLDAILGGPLRVDEARMAAFVPYADGNANPDRFTYAEANGKADTEADREADC